MCGLHLIIASLSSFLSVNKQDNQVQMMTGILWDLLPFISPQSSLDEEHQRYTEWQQSYTKIK